jgi:hypothetical protein
MWNVLCLLGTYSKRIGESFRVEFVTLSIIRSLFFVRVCVCVCVCLPMKNFRISEFVVWTDSNPTPSSASHRLMSELPTPLEITALLCSFV